MLCQVPPAPFFTLATFLAHPIGFQWLSVIETPGLDLISIWNWNLFFPPAPAEPRPHLRGWECGLNLQCPHCPILEERFIWRSDFRIISLSTPTCSQFPVPVVLGQEEKERQRSHDPDLRVTFLGTWTSSWHPYPCLLYPLGSLPGFLSSDSQLPQDAKKPCFDHCQKIFLLPLPLPTS